MPDCKSSSFRWFTMQPVTAISASGCFLLIWWMACRHFWSLVLVTVQVFTTKTSAALSPSAISYPAALNRDAKASVSYRLTRQPRVLKEILALFIRTSCFMAQNYDFFKMFRFANHFPIEIFCNFEATILHGFMNSLYD